MSPSFFILISCSIFVFLFIKKIWPGFLKQLDLYIETIKNEFSKKETCIAEHEKLKSYYQERLQHLHKEIEEQKAIAEEKLNFLKIKLTTELDQQYAYRQKSFKQVIHRLQLQQRKSLQKKCTEVILHRVEEEIKKNPTFNSQYMISLLKRDH